MGEMHSENSVDIIEQGDALQSIPKFYSNCVLQSTMIKQINDFRCVRRNNISANHLSSKSIHCAS